MSAPRHVTFRYYPQPGESLHVHDDFGDALVVTVHDKRGRTVFGGTLSREDCWRFGALTTQYVVPRA